jgi:hypothetical protein
MMKNQLRLVFVLEPVAGFKSELGQKRKPAAGLIEKRLRFEGDHPLCGWS